MTAYSRAGRATRVAAASSALLLAMTLLGIAPAAHAAGAAPVATPDVGAVVGGQSVTVSPLANDTDPEGDGLALIAVGVPTPGTGSAVQSGNDVVITAAAGYVGPLTVAYTVSDGTLTSDSTITVDVQRPPNRAPVATPDAARIPSGGRLTIDPRSNDSDPDGDPLTIAGAAVASGGGSVTTDGQVLTITAAVGFSGSLVITYTIADARGGQAQSTVTVTVVRAPNRRPVTVGDAVSAQVGRVYQIAPLANDRDPEGGRLTLVKVGKAKYGFARRSGSTIIYRAPKSWTGKMYLRYTVRDASGATSNGTLTITVRGVPVVKPKPAPAPAPSRLAVESALARLGLPTGSADGGYDAQTRRAVCAWRTITGRPANRRDPSAQETRAIVATRGLPAPRGSMIRGVNVSVTCQAAFWVSNGKYRRIMAATTGMPGYRTRLGTHRVFITHRVWRYSTIYPDARMYKPMQFSGGQAIHGSATDRLVTTYPASHGCVRMLHRDIDALQYGGVGNGTAVRVFGAW